MKTFITRGITILGIIAGTPATSAVINGTLQMRDLSTWASTTRLARAATSPVIKSTEHSPATHSSTTRSEPDAVIVIVPATITLLWTVQRDEPSPDPENSIDDPHHVLDGFAPLIANTFDHFTPVGIDLNERRRYQSYSTLFSASTHTISFVVTPEEAPASHPILFLQTGPGTMAAPIPEPTTALIVGLGVLFLVHRLRHHC